MNYSSSPNSVRVDFFQLKRNLINDTVQPGLGRWTKTEAIVWPHTGKSDCSEVESFAAALVRHLRHIDDDDEDEKQKLFRGEFEDCVAICLHPYHDRTSPLSLIVSEAFEMVNARPGILRRLA